MDRSKLCILCGGQSAEHEVSLESTRNVVAAVDRNTYDIVLVGISKSGEWRLHDPDDFLENPDDPATVSLRNAGPRVALTCAAKQGSLVRLDGNSDAPVRIDVAFPVLHGSYGEDGAIQGLLKMANVPCVGCDIASSAVCMGKDLTKSTLRQAGLRVAGDVILSASAPGTPSAEAIVERLGLPVFVKPAKSGSSVGITKVTSVGDLRPAIDMAFRYDRKVLVEERIAGREIECSVLGNREPRASVPGEVVAKDYYSYEAKYLNADAAELKAPADLDAETTRRVQKTAMRSFIALSCSGLARVDMFLTKAGEIVVNEVNTIPGFTNISMYPKLWELTGLPYRSLVGELIRLAGERFAEEQALITDFQQSAGR